MHAQLSILVRILRGSAGEEVLEFIEQELARANLVGDDELDPRVAAIGCTVLYREAVLNVRKVGILTLPGTEQRIAGAVSLFEPEGACLLGLSEGQSKTFWSGNNAVCNVTLESIMRR
jgi:transcription elongation GreA/GreB family factor